MSFFIQPEMVDRSRRRAAIERLRQLGVRLPTWSELADPGRLIRRRCRCWQTSTPIRRTRRTSGACTGSTVPTARSPIDVPGHIVLPPELTGVKAPIVVLLGCRFPMIGAHKVLAAYACLVPRLVTGQFDPSESIARSGLRPEIIVAAGSRFRASWDAAASPCCPPA